MNSLADELWQEYEYDALWIKYYTPGKGTDGVIMNSAALVHDPLSDVLFEMKDSIKFALSEGTPAWEDLETWEEIHDE